MQNLPLDLMVWKIPGLASLGFIMIYTWPGEGVGGALMKVIKTIFVAGAAWISQNVEPS